MSDQSSDGTEPSQCTDKTCVGEAEFALWMGDRFSRVRDAHPAMSYDSGDLHPHVCENCLPRYERHHGDKGEFIRPGEKLATDGGRCSAGTEHCGLDHDAVEEDGLDLCPVCGELIVPDFESKLTARIVPDLLPPLPGDDGTDGRRNDRSVDTGIDRSEGGDVS